MSESMVERVAKVLAWDHHRTEENWEEWVKAARAAIEAMREPTDSMWAAGTDERLNDGASTHKVWRAMIDEALSKEPAGT